MNGAYSLWAGPDELVAQLIEVYLARGHRGGRESARRRACQHIKSHVVNIPYVRVLQEGANPLTESPPASITTGHTGQRLNGLRGQLCWRQQQHQEENRSHQIQRSTELINNTVTLRCVVNL